MKHKYPIIRSALTMMTLSLLFISFSYGQVTLKHSYTFEDDLVTDVVGGANGVLHGAATAANGALQLYGDEEDAFVSLPGKEIMINEYTSITVEAVFLQDVDLSGYTVLYAFGAINPEADWMGINYFHFQPTRDDVDSLKYAISCLNTNDPWVTESGIFYPHIADSDIHYVVTILTETDMTLYLDGELIGIQGLEGDNYIWNVSTDTAFIGASVYTQDPNWKGEVYKLNIYEGVLDEATIKERAENPLASSIEKVMDNSIQVFPTITSEHFTVRTENGQAAITVFDISGKIVSRENTTSNETSLYVPGSGMYFVRVESGLRTETFKVIKE